MITGSGILTQAGSALTVVTASNNYTGGTTVSGGTLRTGNISALGTGAVSIGSGAMLDLYGNSLTISSLPTATGTITDTSAGPSSGTLTITTATGGNGTLIKDNGSAKIAVQMNNSNGNYLTTNSNNTFSGGLIMANNSRIIPYAASSYTFSGGSLTAGPFGIGPIYFGVANGNSECFYFNGANETIPNNIVVNTATGTDRPPFRIDSTGETITGNLLLNQTAMFGTNGTGTITLYGSISGSAADAIDFSDAYATGITVILSNTTAVANSYAGSTNVQAHDTLQLGGNNQIPAGSTLTVNGKFYLEGYSASVNALSGTGTIDGISGSPVLTIGASNASGTYSGDIVNSGGSLALVKLGTGSELLSGTNTFGGGTTISNGTLQLGSALALGASNGGMTVNGGVLDINGNSPTVGQVTLTGGGQIGKPLESATLTGSGFALQSGFVRAFLAGPSAALNKTTSGTVILYSNAVNSYGGGTTVSGGLLQLGNNSSLGLSSGSLALTSGTLDLAGYSPTVASLSGTGGAIFASSNGTQANSVLTVNQASNTTYNGRIIDGSTYTVGLVKGLGGMLRLGAPATLQRRHERPSRHAASGQLRRLGQRPSGRQRRHAGLGRLQRHGGQLQRRRQLRHQ